jgi:hypothetical protein
MLPFFSVAFVVWDDVGMQCYSEGDIGGVLNDLRQDIVPAHQMEDQLFFKCISIRLVHKLFLHSCFPRPISYILPLDLRHRNAPNSRLRSICRYDEVCCDFFGQIACQFMMDNSPRSLISVTRAPALTSMAFNSLVYIIGTVAD